jgi:hypothetical protein
MAVGQSASVSQQPAGAWCEQVWLVVEHWSTVHAEPSSQSPSTRQQPVTGA